MPLPLLAIPAAVQAGVGLYQTLFSGKKKAQREMEDLAKNSPKYTGGKSIFDYYNQAKQRASVSATDLASYKTQMQNIGANSAAATAGLQDRRSGLAGIGGIVENANRATQNAVVQGENEQSRRFQQLGGAASMKTGEETKQYQYNALNPYLRQYQLSQQKAAAAANTQQTGIQNLFNGATAAASIMGGKEGSSTSKSMPFVNESTAHVDMQTMPNMGVVDRPLPPSMNLTFGNYGNAPMRNTSAYRPPALYNKNYNWLGKN